MHFGKEMVGCICTGFWGIGVNGSGILIVIHILAIQENDKVQHQRLAIVHIGWGQDDGDVFHQKLYHPYDSEYLHMCFIEYAGLTDGTSISAFLETKENMAKPSFI